jgi:hypothetical protein
MVLRFWHPVFGLTSFLQLGLSDGRAGITAFRDRPVYTYPYEGSYDGISYAQIARHPLLDDPGLRSSVDNLGYRARRILPPALAWAAAGGNPALIVHVYAWLNVAVWLLLAAVLWRLLPVRDARGWIAWAGLLFSAGALASVRLALTDLAALTAIALAMLALEGGRGGRATGWLAAAGLCRETSLAAVAALWTGRGPAGLPGLASLRRTVLAALPLALWIAYIRWKTGPFDSGWGNFSLPFTSFIAKWGAVLSSVRSPPDPLLAWTTLLATAGLTAQGAAIALTAGRRSLADPWWRLGAAYVAVMLVLGSAVWAGYPGAATRVLLPMSLAFAVLASRRRVPLALLLAGSLVVPAGLLCMRDTAPHPTEIAAGHAAGIAYVARAGDGWYQVERGLWHSRTWSSGGGRVDFETWPHDTRTLIVEFSTRSLVPRTVSIFQDGALVWRGAVGPSYARAAFPVRVSSGRASLDFSTDAPAVPADPGTRPLAFAIRDLTMAP